MLARTCFLVVTLTAVSHTAAASDPLEPSVLAELNRMRADPAGYARILEQMRGSFRGTLMLRSGGQAPIKTVEGAAALEEAIAALKQAPPMMAMTTSQGLAAAAHDQVSDEGPTGGIGHKGTDGSNSFQRISRHGRSDGLSGEVIDYGWDRARDIVVDLLIDDGIKDRGHRRALLQPLYAQAGVSCGSHSRFKVMCVVEMAETYTDNTAVAFGGAR